jgi:2-phospho-L-lactate guanylyltransferase
MNSSYASHASPLMSDTALAVHAVVPVKELTHAKSRLSSHLSPVERRALALDMLCNVLKVLRAALDQQPALPHVRLQAVWLISRDPVALKLAAPYGVRPLHDDTDGLNRALHLAQEKVIQVSADALLVVPADMPLISGADVAGLLTAFHSSATPVLYGPVCVIAPNQHASGTNALGVTLPSSLPFQFGAGSFSCHLRAAYHLGMRVQVYLSPTLALDIDTPADLEQAQQTWRSQQNLLLDRPCQPCL